MDEVWTAAGHPRDRLLSGSTHSPKGVVAAHVTQSSGRHDTAPVLEGLKVSGVVALCVAVVSVIVAVFAYFYKKERR